MVPAADPTTGYLPPGVHNAGWRDVVERFAGNSPRMRLTKGLLAAAGCHALLLDGSFVSAKALPKDYDGAWETIGVDPGRLDPVLLDFSNRRAAMKAKYLGELFPATALAVPGVPYRDFFSTDRNGVAKSIVQIDLGSLP